MHSKSGKQLRAALLMSAGLAATGALPAQQVANFIPVTQAMLENPDPSDWLMFSRTYDAQRHSPLDQINKDMIYHTAPDGFVIALDARNGELRWETEVTGGGGHISGLIVADNVVISSRACGAGRESCFIAGHDADTGAELWRFHTIPALDEPGGASWGISPLHDAMRAAAWGLPGSYDPATGTVLWGIANPSPYNRQDRHGGDYRNTSLTSPADLYSDSTVALDPETGTLKWYFQHLPGDDWDEDYTNERTLIDSPINPDPAFAKWINDINRRFRAFDDETGTTLWETIVGGTISSSTISYAVDGRQYIAILTGDNLILTQMAGLSGSPVVAGDNTIYVFALPDQ
jgi:glucose dehydrogenase